MALECRVFPCEDLQLSLDQDIVFCSVGEEESKIWPFAGLFGLSDVLDDLVEGSDASASADHVDVVHLVLPHIAVPA